MENNTLQLPLQTSPMVHDKAETWEHKATTCRACGLWEHATQVVLGEGAQPAPLMLVGEQPGNDEDLQGRPFVGPAGQLLDDALQEAGIQRSNSYITNAVKHFKFVPRAQRRIHQKPNVSEVKACKPWLVEEIALVQPQLIVCLGATAAFSVLGRDFKLTQQRGRQVDSQWGPALATYHPSAVLRAPDETLRASKYAALVADLRIAQSLVLPP